MDSELQQEREVNGVPPFAEAHGSAYKTFYTPDSGEMQCGDGGPRCPDCNSQLRKCGIDIYKCRKCGEGWTITYL